MRSPSQRGTRPPCSGRSALPARAGISAVWRARRAQTRPPPSSPPPRANRGCALRARRGRIEIALKTVAQRPMLAQQFEAGVLDRLDRLVQLGLRAADLRKHHDEPPVGAVLCEFPRQRERRPQIVARRAGRQEHDVAVLGDVMGEIVGEAARVDDDDAGASSFLRSFFRLLKARASMSGSTAFCSRIAFHSTQVSCSRSKSASSGFRPRCAAPTANRRASVLLPTPPFWLTKLTVSGPRSAGPSRTAA